VQITFIFSAEEKVGIDDKINAKIKIDTIIFFIIIASKYYEYNIRATIKLYHLFIKVLIVYLS